MKTIEQMADEYVGHPEEIDEFSSASIKRQAFIDGARTQRKIDIEEKRLTARKFYLAGAKDQKKIDIDKACKWLKYRSEYPFTDAIIESFKEYMEEEI